MAGPGLPLQRRPVSKHLGHQSSASIAGCFVVTSETLWVALALVLVIEGLLPFLSPQGWRRAVTQIAQMQDGQIRFFALLAILSGVAMLWF